MDAEHADAVAPGLEGEVLGELDDRGLGDGVGRHERPAVNAGLAGEVDDPAATALATMSGSTSWAHRTMPRTLTSIVVHHSIGVDLPERPDRSDDPGVVHEQVDRSELALEDGDGGGELVAGS